MKSILTYYGGKQKLVSAVLPLFPDHKLYCEPFAGGAAIFFAKQPSEIEVLNDTNGQLMNFYKVVRNDFISLQKKIDISLHSRKQYDDASVIYNHPHLFNDLEKAWAVWILANESYASIIDGSWGYDKTKNILGKKIVNKKKNFTEEYAIRLQTVQLECADALYIIKSRDGKGTFHYCDPPYFNSDCGHYKGYTESDFEALLRSLSTISGKFLLSSYPSLLLEKHKKKYKWHQKTIERRVSLSKGRDKIKVECLTANYFF